MLRPPEKSDTPITKISITTLSQSQTNIARTQIQREKTRTNNLMRFGNFTTPQGRKKRSYLINRVTRVTK